MWKLVIYVTCVVILIPNTYCFVDYTTYLLSRLTDHVNQVNNLLKMIYKQRHYQGQPDSESSGFEEIEHEFMYDNAIWQTGTALKNTYRVLTKLKNDMTTSFPDMLPYPGTITPSEYDIDRNMGFKQSGRRSAKKTDWSGNFYEALAGAFKKFLAFNPDVRNQLGDDFNADALINPPEPEKK